MERHERRETE